MFDDNDGDDLNAARGVVYALFWGVVFWTVLVLVLAPLF
jgi:hypothetical protein